MSRTTRRRTGARLRPLGEPAPLRVWADRGGRPLRVLRRRGKRPERIATIRDVWRIDDEWWRVPVSRIYYEAVLEGGGLLTLYRDLRDGSWHAQ